jgi:hypothetical protein
MHSIVLAMSLLAQTPDHGFERAMEDWVIQTIPGPIIASEHAPREIGRWIDQLGNDCWKCREIAKKKLKGIGDPAVPWLLWGLRSRDAQIRMSSWLLIRDLAGCRYCRGTGNCVLYEPDESGYSCLGCGCSEYRHVMDVPRPCNRCEGRVGSLDIHSLSF